MIKRLTAIALLVCIIAAFCPTGVFAANSGIDRTLYFQVLALAPKDGGLVQSVKWSTYDEYGHHELDEAGEAEFTYKWYNTHGDEVGFFSLGDTYKLQITVTSFKSHYPNYLIEGQYRIKVLVTTVSYTDIVVYEGVGRKSSQDRTFTLSCAFEPMMYPVEEEISVKGVVPPVVGENPSFDVCVDSKNERNGAQDCYITDLQWKDLTEDTVLGANARFKEGHDYTVCFRLAHYNYYYFTEVPEYVLVNNKRADVSVYSDDEDYPGVADVLEVSYSFPTLTNLMKGDMDKDGKITVADALASLRIAAKLVAETPEDVAIGDVDGDGIIAVNDALAILRVAAKLADASSLG